MSTSNTSVISELLLTKPDNLDVKPLFVQAKRALFDYLSCYYAAKAHPQVRRLSRLLGISSEDPLVGSALPKSLKPNSALQNGFTAHLLDFDDVQANFRGHPSATIFSALLAEADTQTTLSDLLWAYIQGVELDGQIGKQLNPQHALSGWHSTGTIGTLGATAALGVFKHASNQQLSQMLSIAATQASGLLLQEGTDTKPLTAGFAARNAVTSFELSNAGLSANPDPFNDQIGWLKTIANIEPNLDAWRASWLSPAQLVDPGIWIKPKPFCSSALSSYDAAQLAWQTGITISKAQEIALHFPPGGDAALTQKHPTTGKAGKFSAEYITWLVLSKGEVTDADFKQQVLSEKFYLDMPKINRYHDLPESNRANRPVRLIITTDQQKLTFDVDNPHGSPQSPLRDDELLRKAEVAFGSSQIARQVQLQLTNLSSKLSTLLKILTQTREVLP